MQGLNNMSRGGKANSGSLLKEMQQQKANVDGRRWSERGHMPNISRYPELGGGGRRRGGGGRRGGRTGRGPLGVDFDPPPSVEGEVAPDFYQEGAFGAGPSGAGPSRAWPSGSWPSGS